MPDHEYISARDFLNKMELGHFDGYPGLSMQLGKLSRDQLEEVATILLQRSQAEKAQ
jgi:hypothetical protein